MTATRLPGEGVSSFMVVSCEEETDPDGKSRDRGEKKKTLGRKKRQRIRLKEFTKKGTE